MKKICMYRDGECGMCPPGSKIVHPFICKRCKVPVVGRFDTRPIIGYVHGKKCPRRFK